MSVIKSKTKRSDDHASQSREDPKPSDFAAKSISNDDRLLMSIRKQIESREKRPKKVELALAELTGESLPKAQKGVKEHQVANQSKRGVQMNQPKAWNEATSPPKGYPQRGTLNSLEFPNPPLPQHSKRFPRPGFQSYPVQHSPLNYPPSMQGNMQPPLPLPMQHRFAPYPQPFNLPYHPGYPLAPPHYPQQFQYPHNFPRPPCQPPRPPFPPRQIMHHPPPTHSILQSSPQSDVKWDTQPSPPQAHVRPPPGRSNSMPTFLQDGINPAPPQFSARPLLPPLQIVENSFPQTNVPESSQQLVPSRREKRKLATSENEADEKHDRAVKSATEVKKQKTSQPETDQAKVSNIDKLKICVHEAFLSKKSHRKSRKKSSKPDMTLTPSPAISLKDYMSPTSNNDYYSCQSQSAKSSHSGGKSLQNRLIENTTEKDSVFLTPSSVNHVVDDTRVVNSKRNLGTTVFHQDTESLQEPPEKKVKTEEGCAPKWSNLAANEWWTEEDEAELKKKCDLQRCANQKVNAVLSQLAPRTSIAVETDSHLELSGYATQCATTAELLKEDEEYYKEMESDEEAPWLDYKRRVYHKLHDQMLSNPRDDEELGVANGFMSQLHLELIDFDAFLLLSPGERQMREDLLKRVTDIVKDLWPMAEVRPFGSYMTNLSLPDADIDIAITNVPGDPVNKVHREIMFEYYQKKMHENGVNVDSYLSSEDRRKYSLIFRMRQVAANMKDRNIVSALELVTEARVPIIKFIDAKTGVKCDMQVSLVPEYGYPSNTSAHDTSLFIKDKVKRYPAIRPIVMYLKLYLYQRGLNETFTGGIGSYLLTVMVIHVIQLMEDDSRQFATDGVYFPKQYHSSYNLASILMYFLKYYAFLFKYETEGVDIVGGQKVFEKRGSKHYEDWKKWKFCVLSPLCPEDDIGAKAHLIRACRNAFTHGHHSLRNMWDHIYIHQGSRIKSLLAKLINVKNSKLFKTHMENLKRDGLY